MRVHRFILTPAVNGDEEHETLESDGFAEFNPSQHAVFAHAQMPAGVKVLGAALTSKGPVVYALVDENDTEDVTHSFVLAGNGVDLPDDVVEADYVTTIKPHPGSHTLHVFTKLP